MSWEVWLLTVINLAAAAWTGRQVRRGKRYAEDTAVSAVLRADLASRRADMLQQVIDRAWDAAHEFGDEPRDALSVICAHLEHVVTPLPADLERALSDPSIVVDRDHEVRLADGRTLAEHMAEWRAERAGRPCGGGSCEFGPPPGGRCVWCGWERPRD